MYFIEQTDEQDFITIKNLCSSFYTVWRMNRQIVDWEKISANYMYDKKTCILTNSESHSVVSDSLQPHSMEFSRPEYWNGQPFLSPWDLPNPGMEPRSPAQKADSLPAEPQGKPKNAGVGSLSLLQGIFSTRGVKLWSPVLQVDSLPTELYVVINKELSKIKKTKNSVKIVGTSPRKYLLAHMQTSL